MAFDLIYTRKNDATELSLDSVIDNCPAVLTNSQSPETTERYGFVSTYDAMQVLGDYGYRPTQAIQRPSRKISGKPYAAHLIAFAHDNDLQNPYNDSRSEVLLYNSHDGKSALNLLAGAFRFACSNGLVAGEGYQAKMRHNHKNADQFESLLHDTLLTMPKMQDSIARMQQKEIDQSEILDFVQNAATLRWEMLPKEKPSAEKPFEGVFSTNETLQNLARIHRSEDIGLSAWNIFNVVQENLINGGANVLSFTKRLNENGRIFGLERKAKAVKSLSENIRINRSLWDLAETKLLAA